MGKNNCNGNNGYSYAYAHVAFLFVHSLVGQAAEQDLVGGVVGVDGDAYAACDGEVAAGDYEWLAQGVADAVQAAVRN